MFSRYLLPALLLGLGLVLLAGPGPAAPAEAARINRLIEQMGSGDFDEREKAGTALDAIGEPALPALRKAAQGEDVEVRKRAGELVQKIEKRLESARLLAPKRVHLVYKETPLPEALADFQKQSGYTLSLLDPENKLKDRTITLDTGDTTFWHAFDLFCRKAGLSAAAAEDLMLRIPAGVPGGAIPFPGGAPGALPGGKPGAIKPLPAQRLPIKEVLPVPPPEKPEAPGKLQVAVRVDVGALAQAPGAPAADPAARAANAKPLPPGGAAGGLVAPAFPATSRAPGAITLAPGKPKALPTDDSSAVRVRALEKADMFGPPADGQTLIALEVTPEPKLQWQRLVSVRVDKAVDDQGQKLPQVTEGPGAGPGGVPPAAGPAIAVIRKGFGKGFPVIGNSQYAEVRLKKGESEKASKVLKELKGTISAQFLTEARPYITVDNILKAAGKTVKGPAGGSIKVLEVKKDDNGQITIRFEVEPPANVIPDGGSVNGGGIRPVPVPIRIRRAAVPPGAGPGLKAAPPPAPAAAPPKAAPPAGAAAPAVAFVRGVATFNGGFNGLTLQDDKGNVLPVRVGMTWQAGGGAPEYNLLYVPQKDKGEPAKLVFSGRKAVDVDIPFTLKDVPLP
jgi:hypothetical protein